MEFTGVTITGGVLVESAGIVPVDNDFVFTVQIPESPVDEFGFEIIPNIDEFVQGTIYWGDNTSTSFDSDYIFETHTWPSAGTYQVRVTGNVYNIGIIYYITSVDNWNNLLPGYISVSSDVLTNVPNSIPANVGIRLATCTAFNDANVLNWNLSNTTDTKFMFQNCTNFNQNISGWNTANVTEMQYMFAGASAFNQNIGNWNVGNVTDMERMFENATVFNQDLTGWCVTNIPTEPTNFATGSALDANNYPVWGTCP